MSRDTIEANQFFLIYHGNGYTQADVDGMTLDELFARSQRLLKQKQDEKSAYEEAARKAKVSTKRRR